VQSRCVAEAAGRVARRFVHFPRPVQLAELHERSGQVRAAADDSRRVERQGDLHCLLEVGKPAPIAVEDPGVPPERQALRLDLV
jgi:hypothetical protein